MESVHTLTLPTTVSIGLDAVELYRCRQIKS
jgi:hypothetical protein